MRFGRFLIGLTLVLTATGWTSAEPLDFHRFDQFCVWSVTERELLTDLADQSLDEHSLLESALIIAGHSAGRISELRADVSQSIARSRKQTGSQPSVRVRLRKLFQQFHAEFLQGEYHPDLYDVGVTIEKGDFNCLTATILFRTLCQAHGIEVAAVWEPSHVQCWVRDSPSGGYLVETTADKVSLAITPWMPTQDVLNRQLTSCELIAKVFYNRGVCELRREEFEHALAMTWASSVLDVADVPAANNVLACFNNWALREVQQGEVASAKQLLQSGLTLSPDYPPFVRNQAMLLGN